MNAMDRCSWDSEAIRVGPAGLGVPVVILLHGFAMTPQDLAPFARAAGGSAAFVFPRGGVEVPAGVLGRREAARTWWPVDLEKRAASLAHGPRDLSAHSPSGVEAARDRLRHVVDGVRAALVPSKLLVGGFSQGAMLALDWLLEDGPKIDGLILLSGARIRADRWAPLMTRVTGMRVYQSHGKADPDLSFDAAVRLRDQLVESGATVDWHEFAGGHETPLLVWRTLKRFVASVTNPAQSDA